MVDAALPEPALAELATPVARAAGDEGPRGAVIARVEGLAAAGLAEQTQPRGLFCGDSRSASCGQSTVIEPVV